MHYTTIMDKYATRLARHNNSALDKPEACLELIAELCLLLMNNKTCYAVVMAGVLKKDVKDFGQDFKERLFRQLDHDFKINERQEIAIRRQLAHIFLSKSNNDKKILGTINHHIENLKYNNYPGGIENWNEVEVSRILNDYPIGTKLNPDRRSNRNFFIPVELMRELLTENIITMSSSLMTTQFKNEC